MCVCMCDRVGVYRRVICVLNLLFTHGVQNRCHLNTITCPSPHRLSNALTMHVRNFGGQSNRAVFDSEWQPEYQTCTHMLISSCVQDYGTKVSIFLSDVENETVPFPDGWKKERGHVSIDRAMCFTRTTDWNIIFGGRSNTHTYTATGTIEKQIICSVLQLRGLSDRWHTDRCVFLTSPNLLYPSMVLS